MELGEDIWTKVSGWNLFYKDTIGKQIVRAADSVSANISEGFGRFYYKDSKNFYYYSRGSLFETKTWLQKAFTRKLISGKEYNEIINKIDFLGAILNNYIKSIGPKSPP